MTNPYKTKRFLKLKDIWAKKLKESGFEDIERVSRAGTVTLAHWDSLYYPARYTPESFAQRQEYYLAAHHFLNSFKFKTKTDRLVWKLHSQGVGVRQIAIALLDQGIRSNKDYVAQIIKRLRAMMREAPKECENEISSPLDPSQGPISG